MGLFTKKEKPSSCAAPNKPNKLTKTKQDTATTSRPSSASAAAGNTRNSVSSNSNGTNAPRGILRKPSAVFYVRESIDANGDSSHIPMVPSVPPPTIATNNGQRRESGTRTRQQYTTAHHYPQHQQSQSPHQIQPYHYPQNTRPHHRGSEPNINASAKQYPADRLRFASLPTDHLPSTNENPYNAMHRPSTASSMTLCGPTPRSCKLNRHDTPKPVIRRGFYRYHSQTLDFEVFKPPQYDSSIAARHDAFFVSTEPRFAPLANYAPHPGLLPPGTSVHSLGRYPFLDLGLVTKSLRQALKKEGKRIDDYLEVDDIVAFKCWETDEVEGLKDCTVFDGRKHVVLQAERNWRRQERQYHVFGCSLKILQKRNSTWVPIFGYMHQVPKVAALCIEKLYASGMDTPKLFQRKAEPGRLASLVCHYDQFEPHSKLPDLAREHPVTIAALLSTFIGSVQGPIIHRTYFDALWAWCVQPTIARETEYRRKLKINVVEAENGEMESGSEEEDEDEEIVLGPHGLPSFNSRAQKKRRAQKEVERAKRRQARALNPELARKNRIEARSNKRKMMERDTFVFETQQVATARFVLMCLPPHAFSFMMYVFTFLAALPQHPENGVKYDLLADMYAWQLLGGPNRCSSEAVMRWLLSRWWRIADGFKSDAVRDEEQRLRQEFVDKYGDDDDKVWNELSKDDKTTPTPETTSTRSSLSRPSGSGYFDKPHAEDPNIQHEEKELYNPHDYFQPKDVSKSPSPASAQHSVHFPDPPQTPALEIGEDTTVISPFNTKDEGYATDEEGEDVSETSRTAKLAKAVSVASEWAPPQREAFAAIEDLLQSDRPVDPLTPGCETDGFSVYSQDTHAPTPYDDDITVESLIDEYAEGRTPGAANNSAPAQMTEDPIELKKQLQAALEERDRAEKRIEAMHSLFIKTAGGGLR